MSDSKAPSQVDPAQPPSQGRADKAQPIDADQHKGLQRLPTDVKSTLGQIDSLILQLMR